MANRYLLKFHIAFKKMKKSKILAAIKMPI